jgi:hypothetical protein
MSLKRGSLEYGPYGMRTHSRLGLMEMVRVQYLDVDLVPSMPKVWWYG